MSQYALFTGPILAGTQFNWALLGTLTLQVYIFSISFPNERIGIKALVYGIYFLDVVQTAISTHFAYAMLVEGWGNPSVLTDLPWSSTAIPIFTGLISASVQIFFAWRIYSLKGTNPYALGVAVFIVLLALMQSFAAIISDAEGAVCDMVITLTMTLILSSYRKETPWEKTDTLITKLIVHIWETGAATSFVAIVNVVLFINYPGNYLHEAPAFMLGKVYSNSLLASLNSRARARAAGGMTGATFSGDIHELQWRRDGTFGPDHIESRKVDITMATTADVPAEVILRSVFSNVLGAEVLHSQAVKRIRTSTFRRLHGRSNFFLQVLFRVTVLLCIICII
ncbi:hypothetical protein C8R43DRAFT_1234758 [Mycena crocata]|nr:hypothetical protein C8R43DRAFT_1234758 [Mycena crocata]